LPNSETGRKEASLLPNSETGEKEASLRSLGGLSAQRFSPSLRSLGGLSAQSTLLLP